MGRQAWPGDGVGRGNGAGSRATQFQSGMPSGNPQGRPRKPKLEPDASIKDAALRLLLEPVVTTENGVRRKRTRAEAMMMMLFAEYSSADTREKLAIIKCVVTLVPEAGLPRDRDNQTRSTAMMDLVNALAAEADRAEQLERDFER